MRPTQQLGGADATGFVGREGELAQLLLALDGAQTGRGSLFLIGGEPGIGKSRLADEFAGQARESGALVAWGRCWEGGGAPAYWPWVQVIRSYMRSQATRAIAERLGPQAADLAQIVPELADTGRPTGGPSGDDPEAARFRLFDATASFLRQAAADRALVVVIDDLQAADTPSILLLRFVAGQLSDMAVVILATYRDVELTPAHPLTPALAEMLREPSSHEMSLHGLDAQEVALIARRRAGVDPSAPLVAQLYKQTNGNPLFVGEAIRLLAAEGGLGDPSAADPLRLTIPGAVREVILRRLEHISAHCRELLTLASVLGAEAPREALRRLGGLSAEDLYLVLDEAIAAGLLHEIRGSLGRYRVAHDLIREVLYNEISSSRRIALHLRAAQTLAGLYANDPEPHLGEIAHHYYAAVPAAEASEVVDYSRRAGDHAARQLAFEEAVRLYRMALQAMELGDRPDEVARCELMLDLGDAQMRAGESARARETFLGAAAIARRLEMREHLARAALGYGGRFVWARAANDRQLIPLLEGALKALGKSGTLLRARVLARLAGALRDQQDPSSREQLSGEAVQIARALQDPGTLAYALDGRYSAIWAPDTIDERLRIANEIIDIADRTGETERAIQGRHYRLAVYLERGDIAAVRLELEANSRLADELRQPAQRWYIRATGAILSLMEGRFDDSEALISWAYSEGRQAEGMHAFGVVLIQQYALRREQDRAAELEDAFRGAVDEYAFWPWMRCVLAHLCLEIDKRSEARSLLEALASPDFSDLPWDNDWLLGTSLLAELVVQLRDFERATALYALLEPYADRNAYGHPEYCTGSLSRPLGLLAGLLGRFEAAERHFADALEMNERMGAQPWLAQTKFDFAATIIAGGGAADDPRVRLLLEGALDTARDIGMPRLERRVLGLMQQTEGAKQGAEAAGPGQASRAADARPRSTLRREGEYWFISYGPDSFRLRDAKGLHYLARLLAEPGREFLALDLAQSGSTSAKNQAGQPELTTTKPGDGGGPALDEQAKRAYRERLHELQSELDEAEEWHDAERAERARSEMEFITREISGAVGLGGRDRPSGSASERARLSVTRAIRLAMGRIAQHSPALAEHLENTIHTGTYCAYRPDPRVPIEWQT